MGVIGTGSITLYDANDAPVAILSNDAHPVPSNADGSSPVLTGAVSTLSVLFGLEDISSLYSVTATPSSGITGSLATRTYTVSGMTVDAGYVDFTATRTGFPTLTKRFSLSKMKQGPQGPQGIQGIQGTQGVAGTSQYFHVRYSASPDGTGFNTTPNTYIGTAVTTSPTAPTLKTDYTWSQFKGDQGSQGIQGPSGANGITYYLHIAYANSADGVSGFSTSVSTGKTYLGQCVDTNAADPETPASYSWTLIQGAQGPQGPAGANGQDSPRCLGLYAYSSRGTITGMIAGDLAVLYSATAGERGIYAYVSSTWTKQTSPTPDQVTRCFLYILDAVRQGYGTSADYAPGSVSFETLLVGFLFALNIVASGSITGAVLQTADKRARMTANVASQDSDGLNISSGDLDAPAAGNIRALLGKTRTTEPGLKHYRYTGTIWQWMSEFVSFVESGFVHSDWSATGDGGTTKGMISLIQDASRFSAILTGLNRLAPSGDGDNTDLGESTRKFRNLYLSGVAYPARMDCYAIDDDSAPLGTKSTTAVTGITFTVYKPILCILSSPSVDYTAYILARYNSSYYTYAMSPSGANQMVIVMLLPGNYKLYTNTSGQAATLRCLGVYGANSASTFWS